MNYAVIGRDGNFTGVVYTTMTPEINAHHTKFDQTIKPVWGLIEHIDADTGEATYTEKYPDKPIVPQVLSRAQARGALILAGLIDQVQSAIDSIEDPLQRALVQNDWDNRLDFQRDYPHLLSIASAMGLTDEQIDQLFIEGAKL